MAANPDVVYPEGRVGIFWMSRNGKLFYKSAVSLSGAEDYGEFKTYDVSHYDEWSKAQRVHAVWSNREYEEIPRGRVVYHIRECKFIIYLPALLNPYRIKLLKAFNTLPVYAEFDDADLHYQL